MSSSSIRLATTAGLALTLAATVARAGITADQVVDYTPSTNGSASGAAALGPLDGDTGGGNGLNPFNPAFDSGQIVVVRAGGQLTLHLSAPVTTAGGPSLGVFSNNGLVDASNGNGGQATNPVTTFSAAPEAVVSVSNGNGVYVTLNGGNPITFDNPDNYFTDEPIEQMTDPTYGYTFDYEPLGKAVANQFQPFDDTVSKFSGETFDQIKQTLNGSAGGNWLDLSGTGLTSVSDVRFTVPATASYRFIVDSVSGVPEPTTGVVLLGGALARSRGRRRR